MLLQRKPDGVDSVTHCRIVFTSSLLWLQIACSNHRCLLKPQAESDPCHCTHPSTMPKIHSQSAGLKYTNALWFTEVTRWDQTVGKCCHYFAQQNNYWSVLKWVVIKWRTKLYINKALFCLFHKHNYCWSTQICHLNKWAIPQCTLLQSGVQNLLSK